MTNNETGVLVAVDIEINIK